MTETITKMKRLLDKFNTDKYTEPLKKQFIDQTEKALKGIKFEVNEDGKKEEVLCTFVYDDVEEMDSKFVCKNMFRITKDGPNQFAGKTNFDEFFRKMFQARIMTEKIEVPYGASEVKIRMGAFNWALVGGHELAEFQTPANDKVLTKYNMAAEIVNNVLKELIAEVKDGAEIGQLCSLGDKRMLELTGNLFKREKKVQKGIAMPTCISVDNCVCHFSPLKSEPPVLLEDGQVVKVDLGVHVDGYIATAAHTVVVGASKDNKVTGKKANAILSAYNAMEMVLRMLKPAKELKNMDITDRIGKLAKIYETTPIENMLSHQVERFKTVGDKQIIQNPGDEQKSKTEKCTFANHEVYTIDILISSGEGKAKTHEAQTTVFKKVDVNPEPEAESHAFYFEAQQKFGSMPFSLRHFDDEKVAKVDSAECAKHDLMQPYQVLYERDGEFVAQFKCTAIIMPSGIYKIAGLPLDRTSLECQVKIDNEEIQALLSESLKEKKKPATGAAKKEGEGEKKEGSGKVKVEQKKEESGGKVDGAEAKKDDENSNKEKSAKKKKAAAK